MSGNKKKSQALWIALFVFNIFFLLALVAACFVFVVRMDLREEKRNIVLGAQKAPTSIADWFMLEHNFDAIDMNGVHQDVLAPLQTNYSEYTNCSFAFDIGGDGGWLDIVSRDGDEAYGEKQGRFFYARKAEQGADIYILVDSVWYHYLDSKSHLFFDAQTMAEAALDAQFNKLPKGGRCTYQGFVFESYEGESEDSEFYYKMMSCGHLEEIKWDNIALYDIKNIGKISVDAERLVDFDNVVEIESWEEIFNQARRSEDIECLD